MYKTYQRIQELKCRWNTKENREKDEIELETDPSKLVSKTVQSDAFTIEDIVRRSLRGERVPYRDEIGTYNWDYPDPTKVNLDSELDVEDIRAFDHGDFDPADLTAYARAYRAGYTYTYDKLFEMQKKFSKKDLDAKKETPVVQTEGVSPSKQESHK